LSNRSLIIVPVDSSQDTEPAVHYAVSIAKQRDADLHAVQVVRRGRTLWQAPENETSLRARLRALRPAAEREGVFLRIVTLRGTPERVIPAYAQLNAASLLVVARHYGSSRLWRTSVVASRLSRSSPVPVLVVPARLDAAAPLSLNHVLAAVDFTVASGVALRAAADLSKRHGARLTVLHAMTAPEHMVFSAGEAAHVVRGLPADAKVLSEWLKRKATALGHRDAEPVVLTGDASLGIIATATSIAADLIVMGVAPRTRIDEAVAGSTLRAVLRRAIQPVLVLPVVAGAHEWIDEVPDDTARLFSIADGMVRRAA